MTTFNADEVRQDLVFIEERDGQKVKDHSIEGIFNNYRSWVKKYGFKLLDHIAQLEQQLKAKDNEIDKLREENMKLRDEVQYWVNLMPNASYIRNYEQEHCSECGDLIINLAKTNDV